MTTYYVSNSADNGYAVGSDANTTTQAKNKATAWLTLNHARATASSGDTIIVNSGTYVESSGAGYLWLTTPLTYSTDGGNVTIQAASGTNYVILFAQASQGTVF